jgi:phosphatidylserine decarboxylase
MPIQMYVGIGFLILTSFLIFVFRDPSRTAGQGVVSPADGTVREVDPKTGLVSIYLALRNVHVTRSPMKGEVTKSSHVRGRHRPAFTKATPENERLELSIKSAIGEVLMVQMAGALARRIVPYVGEGQTVEKGAKLSLIRFGSRVDLRLPPSSVRILATEGQRVRAGVTPIAEVLDGSVE